jgi:hypothetical protein
VEEIEWKDNRPPKRWVYFNYSMIALGTIPVFLVLWFLTNVVVTILGLLLYITLATSTFYVSDMRYPTRVALTATGLHTSDVKGRTHFFPWSSLQGLREIRTLTGDRRYGLTARTKQRSVFIPLVPEVRREVESHLSNYGGREA